MKKGIMAICCVTLSLVAIIGFIGCETTDGGDGLTVEPSKKELTENEKSVTFTVGGSSTDTNGNTITSGGIRDLSAPFI